MRRAFARPQSSRASSRRSLARPWLAESSAALEPVTALSDAVGRSRSRTRHRLGAARAPRVQCRLPREVDTTDEWIVERTGIRFRHIASRGETTATLGADAARAALERGGHDAPTRST